jgi:cation-transporting P-type ATPase F
MDSLLGRHWHHLPADEALQLLDTNPQTGLDIFEIKHRREHFGPNALTPKKGKSSLVRFLLQFNNPLIYILLASAVITAVIKDPLDAAIILAVVLINAIIGFVQESKAEQAMAALAQVMTTSATVRRSGETQRVPAQDLVPGDIVLLQAGDKVPADLRLIQTRDLQIAEAALTGEAVPVQKDGSALLDPDAVLADRSNMAYASTLVTYGFGTGVAVGIGDGTEVGRISHLIAEAKEIETPLTRKLAQFSQLVLYAILGLVVVTFGVGLLRGEDPVEIFTAVVALAVAMIPEGLPAALTITLAIGVSRMARRRAIIRKLPAVETLGGVTVICSDKTGTLTQNQMTVRQIVAGSARYEVTGDGYAPDGEIVIDGQPVIGNMAFSALQECLICGALCNDSALVDVEGRWQAHGDPTEAALLASARKGKIELARLRQDLPRLDTIPFDSAHQYMATLHPQAPWPDAAARDEQSPATSISGDDAPPTVTADDKSGPVVYVKGAVEAILERCDLALEGAGQPAPAAPERVYQDVKEMATRGLRVLAFARKEMPPGASTLTHQDVASGLTFLGLQGMIDPPRREAIAAVRVCQNAGIRVKMITGDHALTAAAIAAQIGLARPCTDGTPSQECVLTGRHMADYSDQQMIDAVDGFAVFARVSPEQKLRLVEALQARSNVVAMTGDGVNDGPALRQADIGIAMGISGTEVAKEAADMVLTDDNFATIEAAIEEGRGVFDNLTKIIAWMLPTNIGEGLIIMIAILAGIALPLLPVHILWINTISATVLGLVLALELKEPDIMTRRPRPPDAPILSRVLVFRMLLVGILILLGAFGLYELELLLGTSETAARTVAVNAVVALEIFYVFNCRSLTRSTFQLGFFSNRWVIGGVVGMIALQLLFTYAPFMNQLFLSAPLDLTQWGHVLAVGLVGYLIVEIEKWLRRRVENRRRIDARVPA